MDLCECQAELRDIARIAEASFVSSFRLSCIGWLDLYQAEFAILQGNYVCFRGGGGGLHRIK